LVRNLRGCLACLAGGTLFFATAAVLADAPAPSNAERSRIEYIQKALKGEPSPVPGRRMIGSGTGFFVAPHRVLTNHHVVERCSALTVRGIDGKTVTAELVADEKSRDLALINTEAVAVSVATFRATATTRIGEMVAAVGYPDQGLPRIEPFLTVGTMAAADRADGPSRFVIRADVRPGNSGGPVLDERGQVVGVVNAKIDTVRVYQRTGQTIDNVGFAIATGPVLAFLKQSDVKPSQAEAAPIVGTGEDLLAKAKQFTVRVACWQ
jgi:S1-C subfamily serine protease